MRTFFITLMAAAGLAFGGRAFGEPKLEQGVLVPLKMRGVDIGMSLANVISLLGEPRRRLKHEGFVVLELRYRDIVIGLDEKNTVVMMESRSPSACLLTKVCAGALIDDMQEELASHDYSSELRGGILYLNADSCWGEIALTGGVAQSVRVICSP